MFQKPTHAESIFLAPISGMLHASLASDSSGTRFWRRLRQFYSKPECEVHVSEMMTCDWSMITVDDFTWCEVVVSSVVICLNIFSHAYFWHQKFSFQTLNTE